MNQQRYLLYLCLAGVVNICIMTTVVSQEISLPPEHEKKVYTNEEGNKIYWPIDVPFHLWLSASPDVSAPKFLLDQLVIDESTNETEYLEEGIRLEISGNQFIRWINSVTKEEMQLKFYADGIPPVIADSLYEAPRFISDSTIYYGKGLKCKIKAFDRLSGVKQIYFSIDGKPFQDYNSPISLDREKPYNIRYYAVDNTGYANQPVEMAFVVDLSPPVTLQDIKENYIENVLSISTKITLAGQDEISGMNKVYYKFDDTPDFAVYDAELHVSQLTNGAHVLYYYSVDKVENSEEVNQFDFFIDKKSPETTVSIRGEQHEENENQYVSAHSLIQFEASDDQIGVENIYYAINKTRDFRTYENPFPLSLKSGKFSISFYAVDKLGNKENTQTKYYQMDLSPPITENSITGSHYAQRSTVWITKNTRITLEANDSESGLKETHYIIGENEPVIYKNNPVQVEEEGNYLFRYFSYDNVGNREGDNVLLLIADNSPPDIKEIFSVSPVDTIVENGEQILAYPQYTSLFLAATDMSSGLKGVWYAMNGNEEEEYYSSILCNEIGRYNISVRAMDNLEHTATKQISFIIRKLDIE